MPTLFENSAASLEKTARQVALKPHLNIGVFALEANAPHWNIWKKKIVQEAGALS